MGPLGKVGVRGVGVRDFRVLCGGRLRRPAGGLSVRGWGTSVIETG